MTDWASEKADVISSWPGVYLSEDQEIALAALFRKERSDGLEEAAECAIDNQDCDAWEIADAIRALKERHPPLDPD